jgi:diacylglycerol kinase family enzyme
MQYGIIINPAAGPQSTEKKREIIGDCAKILGAGAEVAGWDSETAEGFRRLAREMATRFDVLVVAGGDGTMSEVINAVDPETVLAYLPMGSGNAWQSTLGLPSMPRKAAERIRDGRTRAIDLILCDSDRRGLLASVGFEGHALSEREKFLEQGVDGFDAYFRATAKSLLGGYTGQDASVEADGETFRVPRALSIIVTKTPFYGYGFKVVPGAKISDGHLHVLFISSDPPTAISGIVTSLLGGNRFGSYKTCEEVSIRAESDLHLQVDGEVIRKGTSFRFRILPMALNVRY